MQLSQTFMHRTLDKNETIVITRIISDSMSELMTFFMQNDFCVGNHAILKFQASVIMGWEYRSHACCIPITCHEQTVRMHWECSGNAIGVPTLCYEILEYRSANYMEYFLKGKLESNYNLDI